MKRTSIIFLVLLLSAGIAYADFCVIGWDNDSAAFTGGRYRGGGGASGGLFYIWGGQDNVTPYLADTQAYNPGTDTWTAKAAMPAAKANFGYAIVDGYGYAVGGYNGTYLNTVYEYDIAGDAWSTVAAYPGTYAGIACSGADDGKLYCFGGTDGTAKTNAAVYDPVGDAWTPIAPLPAAKMYGSATSSDGTIYIAGGWDTGTVFYSYDPIGDTYATLGSPTGRHGPAIVGAEGVVWLTAGGTYWTELNTADQVYFDAAWAGAGSTVGFGVVAPAAGYVPGYGIYMAGGTRTDTLGGVTHNQLWTICIPEYTSVTPDEGAAGTAITIAGDFFEAAVDVVLFDGTKTDYPLDDLVNVSDTEITATIPAGLTPGMFGLAFIGTAGQYLEIADAFEVLAGDDDIVDDDIVDDDIVDDDVVDDDVVDDDVVDDDVADDDVADDDVADDDVADDDVADDDMGDDDLGDDDLGDDDLADDDDDDDDSCCGC